MAAWLSCGDAEVRTRLAGTSPSAASIWSLYPRQLSLYPFAFRLVPTSRAFGSSPTISAVDIPPPSRRPVAWAATRPRLSRGRPRLRFRSGPGFAKEREELARPCFSGFPGLLPGVPGAGEEPAAQPLEHGNRFIGECGRQFHHLCRQGGMAPPFPKTARRADWCHSAFPGKLRQTPRVQPVAEVPEQTQRPQMVQAFDDVPQAGWTHGYGCPRSQARRD